MSIYLPIAEMNINIFLIVFIGMAVGALSGLFGVGVGVFNDTIINISWNTSSCCCWNYRSLMF